MKQYVLALDQGTTSSRAIIFNLKGEVIAQHGIEVFQNFPHSAWVEQDPEDIWQTILAAAQGALAKAKLAASDMLCCGITNQRETTIAWDKQTGQVLAPAIVWQDRRTSADCKAVIADGMADEIQARTGLVVDPYFSATKMRWLLDNNPEVKAAAKAGRLALGTVDSFLIWRLTNGEVFATDISNASRTKLFNIHDLAWDPELLDYFQIPLEALPEVRSNAAAFGAINADLLGTAIPITGVMGDLQAATFGQACFEPGQCKATFGTGCFTMLNIGTKAIKSKQQLLTTVLYQLDGVTSYGLEGAIFNAGSVIKWLRDGLSLIESAKETETLAQESNSADVYFVPALTGLGAPYWQPEVRGTIMGLTRGSNRADIVRAALDAIHYQLHDLLIAMTEDSGLAIKQVRVDGGMVANRWFLQRAADILSYKIELPTVTESTARGVALMAALGSGAYTDKQSLAANWALEQAYQPQLLNDQRQVLLSGWRQAINKVLQGA